MTPEITDFNATYFDASREDKLRMLELYYLRHLVEDPQDGTPFDCDILDAIKSLREKHCPRNA